MDVIYRSLFQIIICGSHVGATVVLLLEVSENFSLCLICLTSLAGELRLTLGLSSGPDVRDRMPPISSPTSESTTISCDSSFSLPAERDEIRGFRISCSLNSCANVFYHMIWSQTRNYDFLASDVEIGSIDLCSNRDATSPPDAIRTVEKSGVGEPGFVDPGTSSAPSRPSLSTPTVFLSEWVVPTNRRCTIVSTLDVVRF